MLDPLLRKLDPRTVAVHAGRPPAIPGSGINPPVSLNSTFRLGGPLSYGRDGNETWEALEEAIGALEGGRALVYASGMGAISAVCETLPTPGRVVIAADAYNGTRRYLRDVAARGRLEYEMVDIANTEATLAVCEKCAETPPRSSHASEFGAGGLLWLESPTNPMLSVADLPALISGAHRQGLDVAVDNTFATPLLQRPLDFGADVVVHSGTKFLSGHSDVLFGVAVTRRPEVLKLLSIRRSLHGAALGPFEAWLALRGLRTLAVRVDRSQANAAVLAERLSRHPRVLRTRYPGLEDDPGHERARVQMRGFGAVLSFEVVGGADGADGVVRAVRLVTPATSLGGVETLIDRRGRLEGEEATPPGLLRLSVGIEYVEDLWTDLETALATSYDTGVVTLPE